MQKWLKVIHKLFDPRPPLTFDQTFSLRRPHATGAPPDNPAHAQPPGSPVTPLERLRVSAGVGAEQAQACLDSLQADLTCDAGLTVGRVKERLQFGANQGLIVRTLQVPLQPPVQAHLVFMDGLTDAMEIERMVIQPLLALPRPIERVDGADLASLAERSLLLGRHSQRVYRLAEVLDGVTSGQCALILDTAPCVILLETRGWPGRQVDKPFSEQVIIGPNEAFTEILQTNTGLLRRRVMSPDLRLEPARVGRRSRTNLCICYLEGVANPHLVAEAHRRIAQVDVDLITDSHQLVQFISDSPRGYLPTMQATERTDRAAAAIAEGRIVILVEGSPFAQIAPVVFADFMHVAEDYYLAWPFGTLLRLIRILGLLVTLILPALYIAIADYHQEMIPSNLLLAIAASREAVPFPAPLEVLLMEVAFEIIREGSLRVPSMLGQTIGIVGALILGQAAVQASIVSPILVIVVATTALGSFTIPNGTLSLAIRFARFLFIGLAASFGLFGVAVGLFVLSAHTAALKSFGVPFMAPTGPRRKGSPDVVLRGALEAMERRPDMVEPVDHTRQTANVRSWNYPVIPGRKGGASVDSDPH